VPARSTVSTLTQSEIARNSGFTGNACEQCGSFNLRRTGTCETCEDCGWNKGCG
jgi:ribonucleoside-diphosphate reductase alpha chain